MPVFSINQRLRIALGGFISFTGFIVFVCVILSLTNTANLASVFQGTILSFVITLVGFLDIACGLLLFLGNRKINLSFTSHQKKANDNTD